MWGEASIMRREIVVAMTEGERDIISLCNLPFISSSRYYTESEEEKSWGVCRRGRNQPSQTKWLKMTLQINCTSERKRFNRHSPKLVTLWVEHGAGCIQLYIPQQLKHQLLIIQIEDTSNIEMCIFLAQVLLVLLSQGTELTIACRWWRKGRRRAVSRGSVWERPAQHSRTTRRPAAAGPSVRNPRGCRRHTAPHLGQKTATTDTRGESVLHFSEWKKKHITGLLANYEDGLQGFSPS